jgi:hypothetical protein
MTKALITEQRLIEAINLALRHDWPHKDCHCEVAALRRVKYPERNWEVEHTNMGGTSLLHTEECERLLERVLNELIGKYDVQWAT